MDMVTSKGKDAWHLWPSGKCKFKLLWAVPSGPQEWLIWKSLTTSSAGKDVEQLEISYTAGKDKNLK